jgi:hypothetical protein
VLQAGAEGGAVCGICTEPVIWVIRKRVDVRIESVDAEAKTGDAQEYYVLAASSCSDAQVLED